MEKPSYRLVGKIKEARGLKGELFAFVFTKEWDWADYADQIYLKKFDQPTLKAPQTVDEADSYTLDSVREHKEGLILVLEEVTDRTQAEKLVGQFLYIEDVVMETQVGDNIYLRELLGFAVVIAGQTIGSITDFSSNGPQDLLVVKTETKTVEIPFVEPWIEKIDFENRQIQMIVPEGLLDL